MQPPSLGIWSRIPGWSPHQENPDSDDEDEIEEKALCARAKKGLAEIASVLGDRWLDVPCVNFSALAPDGSAVQEPRVPPSQWGTSGPPISFRLEHVRAPVVRDTLRSNGMKQTSDREWLVMWSGPRMSERGYQGLHELQRVNHFPGSTELTRKDRICAHFERMARRFGSEAFNFLPKTYVLPQEMDDFLEEYQNSRHIWIVKPNAGSQGKGIFLLRDLDELPNAENDVSVISRYIERPLLIQRLKFDLRIYVLVTSFEPLRAYIYKEGLTRFASSPYSTEDKHLGDTYRHLTNYSINKKADNFVENQEVQQDNVGHKWSFSAFNKHLYAVGVSVELMWARIMDLCLKTLISVKPMIASETRRATVHCSNCFELYGFDVLVDQDLKPWLLEVNLSPSMLAESPLDLKVKGSVLSDTFNLIGVSSASWRQLASSKLRSQLQQLRHSMALAGQTANSAVSAAMAAAEAGEATEEEERAIQLAELKEGELKMMAQALKEAGRCNNFIRLYPTKTTVQRYAPLMRAPGVAERLLLRMLLGEDTDIPDKQDHSRAPEVTEPLSPMPRKKPANARREESSSRQPPSACSGPSPQRDRKLTAREVDASNGCCTMTPEKKSQDCADIDWSGLNASIEHDAGRALAAIQLLKPLSMKASSRVVLMEYLVRVVNSCCALGGPGREKLLESKSYKRLAMLRQQLSIFLRTTARAPNQLPLSPAGGQDVHFVDELASSCRASIACVARELWAAASAPGAAPNPEGSGARLRLAEQLPPAFVRSSRGERAIETVQGLSSADLEFIIKGPECLPEYTQLLAASATLEHDALGNFDDLESMKLGDLQSMIQSSSASSGPLSDLLLVFKPQASPQKQEKSPSPVSGSLPNIFSGMPLMAHAAAAFQAQHSHTKAGEARPASVGRSAAAAIKRASPKPADGPSFTVPMGLTRQRLPPAPIFRSQSLPALAKLDGNTARQSFPAPKSYGLASLRTKQQWKRPAPAFAATMDIDL